MLVVNKPVDADAATDEFQIQYEFGRPEPPTTCT